jgi:hypothetical protein
MARRLRLPLMARRRVLRQMVAQLIFHLAAFMKPF